MHVPDHADARASRPRAQLGINLLRADDDTVGISCDETTDAPTRSARSSSAFARRQADIEALDAETPDAMPAGARCARRSFLAHPVFNTHRSETQMLRYLARSPTATSRSTAP